jgi:hypothetical protein
VLILIYRVQGLDELAVWVLVYVQEQDEVLLAQARALDVVQVLVRVLVQRDSDNPV